MATTHTTYIYQVRWRFFSGESGTTSLNFPNCKSIAEIHALTLADIRRVIGWQVPRDFVEFLSIRTRIVSLDRPFLHCETWGAELHQNGRLFLWGGENIVRFNASQALQLYDLLQRNLQVIREEREHNETF